MKRNMDMSSLGALWWKNKRFVVSFFVLTFSYGIFRILWFMIGLKWLMKAWGHIPIFVGRFGNFQNVHQLWNVGPLLITKMFQTNQEQLRIMCKLISCKFGNLQRFVVFERVCTCLQMWKSNNVFRTCVYHRFWNFEIWFFETSKLGSLKTKRVLLNQTRLFWNVCILQNTTLYSRINKIKNWTS